MLIGQIADVHVETCKGMILSPKNQMLLPRKCKDCMICIVNCNSKARGHHYYFKNMLVLFLNVRT